MQFVYSTSNLKRYRFPTHINDLVIDRSESAASEVFVVVLRPSESPPPHKHDDAEQLFYVIEGAGALAIGPERQKHSVKAGDVIRIPPGTLHSLEAEGNVEMRYLAVDCFVAGRPSDEPTWDDHVKALCRSQGWDYRRVAEF